MMAQVQVKQVFEREPGARQVGEFESESGQDPVCTGKQEVNSFSVMRKQNGSPSVNYIDLCLINSGRSFMPRRQGPDPGQP